MDYQQLISEPLADDAVCGQNLEDDAEFQNFFFMAQGTPERYDGENTFPAEPPDWRVVKKQALAYLEQTKDIKLICVLAQAVVNTDGLTEFAACLQGLAFLFENHWQALYPPLDEDDGDPLERVTALAYLNDAFISKTLKALPLASARGVGQVSLNVLSHSGDSDNALSESQIRAIFTENNSGQLQLLYEAVAYSLTSLTSINSCLIAQAGHQYTVNFSQLADLLTQISKVLEQYAGLGSQDDGPAELDEKSASAVNQHSGQAEHSASQVQAEVTAAKVAPGAIASRADVERCLRAINEYYARYEPSSPLPMLIGRALKLVNKDFFEIIKDIYPDALPALYQLGGTSEGASPAEPSGSDDSW